MPIFEYKGMDAAGKAASGILNADSPQEARTKLRRDGVYVTDVTMIKASDRRGIEIALPKFLRGRVGDLALVTRQLSTLLGAGIPLTESLTALIEQAQNQEMEKVLRDVREKVTQGASLGEALESHPRVFSPLYVNMVKAGEAAGNLDGVLTRIADYLQKEAMLKGKISSALAYPAIMLTIGVAVVAVLMTAVVPKISQILTEAGRELPMITRILIGVSTIFRDYWWAIALGIVLLYALFRMVVRTDKGGMAFDRALLRTPIFGELFRKAGISRFSVTLSTLLGSGVTVMDGLRIVKDIVNNRVLADTLEQVHERILEGTDISTPLKKSGVFPPVVGYMVAVGEQSGRLESMLEKISETYDQEIESATQKMTSILEPLLIVFLAVIVGGIVIAILLPILDINSLAG